MQITLDAKVEIVPTENLKNIWNKDRQNKEQLKGSYNTSSTCRGLGILYPSWSRSTTCFPSIRGYGEPPRREQVLHKRSRKNPGLKNQAQTEEGTCCRDMSYVSTKCSCYMSLEHVLTKCLSHMSLLIVPTKCPSHMTLLHVPKCLW